jgi:hypothetical protein
MAASTRNRNAGKGTNTRPGSNLSTGRDYTKQKALNATPTEIAKRVELNAINRKSQAEGKSSVGDKKDVSHKKDGGTVMEAQSKNRARNRGKK